MPASPCSVLFVIRYFHPFIGGLENNTLTLAAALIKHATTVAIATSRFYRKWPARETIHGVPVTRLPSPRIKILGSMCFLLSLAYYLIKNRTRYDMLHVFQVGYTAAATILIGRLLRKPTILTLASSGSGGDIRRHLRTPWGKFFVYVCRLSSRIVVLNKQMYTELATIAYPEQNAVHIPNGVDTTLFYTREDEPHGGAGQIGAADEKIILYAGRLSTEKGVDFLIRAFSEVRKRIPVRLFILGDGSEKKNLEKLIQQCHVENKVHLMHAVENVVPFLHSADVFVLPSRFEGLSNALLEAMACGVPVIATRVTGTSEVMQDGVTGLLVEYNDTEALANALVFLLTHPEKARELAANAISMIRRLYTLEDAVAKYTMLYQSVLQPKTALA